MQAILLNAMSLALRTFLLTELRSLGGRSPQKLRGDKANRECTKKNASWTNQKAFL